MYEDNNSVCLKEYNRNLNVMELTIEEAKDSVIDKKEWNVCYRGRR